MKVAPPFRIREIENYPEARAVAFELSGSIVVSEETFERLKRRPGFEDSLDAHGHTGVLYFDLRGSVYHGFGGYTRARPRLFVPWRKLLDN